MELASARHPRLAAAAAAAALLGAAGIARADGSAAPAKGPVMREPPPGAPGQRGAPSGGGPLPPEEGVDAASAGAMTGAPLAAREEAPRGKYSPYERATIRHALGKLGAIIDTEPEGKIVEGVDVVPLDVIEERDPAPELLNHLHVTSWPYVIRREVLLSIGRPYTQDLADETARNLRGLSQLSLVLVFAVRGSRADRVRVVVVTKDVWSLRLNTNYRFAGGQLEYLFLQPTETNLFGTHHTVAAQLGLDPGSISLGAGYQMPRVGGSRILFRSDINVILGRESGDPEGSFGSFAYGQPLYATEAEWSWATVIAWRREITRSFIGSALRLYDAEATEEEDGIPFIYDSDLLVGSYTLTRSFGRSIKHDFSLGAEASRKAYRAPGLGGFDPAAAAEFTREAVPVSDTRVNPTLEYHTYSTRFMSVLDFNTLALQEDYRVGHEASIKLYPVTQALGSSRDLLGVSATASYTVPLGDGLARAVVESVVEAEEDRLADASIDVSARIHTPSFGFGRLVFDARLLDRYRNYLNRRSELGGDTRLRGYPTAAFIGEDVISANLELRTRPLELWSVQLAGAAFFDAGDAFDGFDDLRVKQSAGLGLRLLFPQLARLVMRADWGFPLTRGYQEPDSLPGDIIVTVRQAFPMPSELQ
ncbi:MAG: hypothetical protein IT372_24600 [Polyangiaceae bacterium]|nr:hypothetical protein [Polyangiaceae bacterium]